MFLNNIYSNLNNCFYKCNISTCNFIKFVDLFMDLIYYIYYILFIFRSWCVIIGHFLGLCAHYAVRAKKKKREIKSNQITFIVTSPQHKSLGEWNSYERAPDSAKKTKQQFTYGQYIFTDCTEDNVQNIHTYTQYTQCTIKTYLVTNAPIHIIHRMYTSALCPHLCIVICEGATDYNLQ